MFQYDFAEAGSELLVIVKKDKGNDQRYSEVV